MVQMEKAHVFFSIKFLNQSQSENIELFLLQGINQN